MHLSNTGAAPVPIRTPCSVERARKWISSDSCTSRKTSGEIPQPCRTEFDTPLDSLHCPFTFTLNLRPVYIVSMRLRKHSGNRMTRSSSCT